MDIHKCMENVDWSLIHSFLATARAGSLSAAARQTGISQPTLGRHIRALEARLGGPLFQRQAGGQRLTSLGADLVPMAEAMEAAAARLSLVAAAARKPGLTGVVRITASRIVAHHLLPPLLADLRLREPGIELELVPSDTSENLLFHEADIALRMYRPTQADVIARHVTNLPMNLYAAPSLLARHGRPQTVEQLLALPFVGFDRNDLILRMMAGLGISRRRDDFALRCDDQLVYWNLVRAGAGVGAMQAAIAGSDPGVERIAPFVPLPDLPLWLATATPLARAPRVKRVWEHLATGLSRPKPLDPPSVLG